MAWAEIVEGKAKLAHATIGVNVAWALTVT
jgi:hypothetical protein